MSPHVTPQTLWIRSYGPLLLLRWDIALPYSEPLSLSEVRGGPPLCPPRSPEAMHLPEVPPVLQVRADGLMTTSLLTTARTRNFTVALAPQLLICILKSRLEFLSCLLFHLDESPVLYCLSRCDYVNVSSGRKPICIVNLPN